jgi:hypothetical protein
MSLRALTNKVPALRRNGEALPILMLRRVIAGCMTAPPPPLRTVSSLAVVVLYAALELNHRRHPQTINPPMLDIPGKFQHLVKPQRNGESALHRVQAILVGLQQCTWIFARECAEGVATAVPHLREV